MCLIEPRGDNYWLEQSEEDGEKQELSVRELWEVFLLGFRAMWGTGEPLQGFEPNKDMVLLIG